MENVKTRLKRLKRAPITSLPGILITNRDTEILRLVYSYRAVTAEQIRKLVFHKTGKSTQCDLRLKLLFHHGYLERRSQAILYEKNKPLIYLLAEKGAQHLAEVDGIKQSEILWRPKHNQVSPYHLCHLLQANDIRGCIEQAAEIARYTLEWLDEFTIRRLKLYDRFAVHYSATVTTKTTLIPDGFFTLDTPDMWVSCFLEVDRGTEPLKTVSQKFTKYLTYFTTSGYLERYGVQDERGNEIYPCVLLVTTSLDRLDNLRTIAASIGAGGIFLFSTFDQVTCERVLSQPIWRQPTGDQGVSLIT